MSPLDPIETTSKQNESPMAPPYVDDDNAIELTEMGMEVAENEKRDAVTREYEAEAIASDDPEEALDDIAYPKGGEAGPSPELAAMRKNTRSVSE